MGDLRMHKKKFTFQKDITLSGLNEILELMTKDPSSPQLHVLSANNLRAMTTWSDRPWWTARDEDGTLVGCVQVSRLGDAYSRLANLFVSPEVRGQGVAFQLFKHATSDLESSGDGQAVQMVLRKLVRQSISSKIWPNQQLDSHVHVAFGVPKFPDDNGLEMSSSGFKIVPFSRGRVFDKMVHYDTAKVHELPRREFLEVYFNEEATKGYVAVSDDGDVVGFGGIQTAINTSSQVLAPLYADNPTIARALLNRLKQHYVPGNNLAMIFIDSDIVQSIVDEIGIPVIESADNMYVNFAHPEKFKKSVYFLSNCGLVFY